MQYDVIIAGAGPVGLFLACELRLASLSVLVFDPLSDPHSPIKGLPFGLRGLWGPSVEAFYRRGLLPEIQACAAANGGPKGAPGQPRPSGATIGADRRGPAGHFGGIQFDFANIDSSRWSYRLPGPSDLQLGITMEQIEDVLAARALSLGVEIRRGHGLDTFDASTDDVTVHAGGEAFRARFLVGCDGGRSTVRKLGGFEFVGTEPLFTGYSVKVDIANPEVLPLGRHSTKVGMYTQWQPGVIAISDFDGGAFHRTDTITLEHVQSVLRRVSETDVTVTALHLASTWTDRSKQVTSYRRGRVLLAGDAAHIHSPLGGQGLNLGLGDAMNLGWKLVRTIRGDAPDGLLDTYTSERHPIGARILEWTRAQVASMRPDPQSRALQSVLRDLIATTDGATYFAERVWNATLRYDLGGDHPLIGRSCPDFELGNDLRVGALLREGSGVLLDFEGTLKSFAGHWGTHVKYVAADATNRLGLTAVLVRPDGFVAWATDTKPNPAELEKTAAKWFTTDPLVLTRGATRRAAVR